MRRFSFGKFFRKFLYRYILPYGGLLVVNLISFTCRLRIIHPENETETVARTGSIIYASWHQRFFPGITFFSRRKPIAIMISQSRDGDFVSRVVEILGWRPVRGSSSHGGPEALRELKELARSGYRIGHIVDGPKGPFGKVKPGMLRIAQAANLPIVPTITSAEKRWVFNSWDKFMVPKPFSRVIIAFGEPIDVPPDLDEAEFEARTRLIEEKMAALYDETDRIWQKP